MERKTAKQAAYGLLSVAAWSFLNLLFALTSGRISRRGPDIYATTDPVAFRNRLVFYALLGGVALTIGVLLFAWQVLRSHEP